MLDPQTLLPPGRLTEYWIHHTGALGLGQLMRGRILKAIGSVEFDLVWVDGGNIISPELVKELKEQSRYVINYNIDDPFGRRDGNRWRQYLRSVPFYDLVAVVRDCNVAEAFAAGAKDVLRVHRSADEAAHAPRKISLDDRTKWESEVAFIGTWMPERGPFMTYLVEHGIPLSIWGNRWSKAEQWPILKSHWRGPGLNRDDDYAMALQCAKVCIGMLSKGNRDLCTQRSFEIPHLGGVLCAERTSEHLSLYEENEEAAFWNNPGECAEKCHRLLIDDQWRSRIARNGQRRAIRNQTSNQIVMNRIVSRVFDFVPAEALISI
jgi:spore maturation protein CgeB